MGRRQHPCHFSLGPVALSNASCGRAKADKALDVAGDAPEEGLGLLCRLEARGPGLPAPALSLPGCFSNGRTVEETKRNMREAVTQHVASLIEHGEPVPPNERLVHVEELATCP